MAAAIPHPEAKTPAVPPSPINPSLTPSPATPPPPPQPGSTGVIEISVDGGEVVTGVYTVPFAISGSTSFSFCLADRRLKAFSCPKSTPGKSGGGGGVETPLKGGKFQDLVAWIKKWWEKNGGGF
jgi:hypothetical protein